MYFPVGCPLVSDNPVWPGLRIRMNILIQIQSSDPGFFSPGVGSGFACRSDRIGFFSRRSDPDPGNLHPRSHNPENRDSVDVGNYHPLSIQGIFLIANSNSLIHIGNYSL